MKHIFVEPTLSQMLHDWIVANPSEYMIGAAVLLGCVLRMLAD